MKNQFAVELGRLGGLKRSEKKLAACRRNAAISAKRSHEAALQRRALRNGIGETPIVGK